MIGISAGGDDLETNGVAYIRLRTGPSEVL